MVARTFRFPDDYRSGGLGYRELYDYERARAYVLPSSLTFEVLELTTRGECLSLPGVLTNDSDEHHELVVTLGVFLLDFAHGAPVTRRPIAGPPMPPPAPPPPMLLEVPPRSRVEMRAELYLPSWLYDGAPRVELQWMLACWNEPRPHGALVVTLPAR